MELDLFRAEAGWGIAELKLIAPSVCIYVSACCQMISPINQDVNYLSRAAHAEEASVSLRHIGAGQRKVDYLRAYAQCTYLSRLAQRR